MSRPALLTTLLLLAACSAGPLGQAQLRGTLGGCPVGSVDCGDGLCWPPGVDCDSAGLCPGADQCAACAGAGEAVSWCMGPELVCCPLQAPLMCGDGGCSPSPALCPGGEVLSAPAPCSGA